MARERMVGSKEDKLLVRSIKTVFSGGSSKVFNSALAAWGLSFSASNMEEAEKAIKLIVNFLVDKTFH